MKLVTVNQREVLDNNPIFNDPTTIVGTASKANKAATQAASAATDIPGIVADFNALLVKLKAAGLMS